MLFTELLPSNGCHIIVCYAVVTQQLVYVSQCILTAVQGLKLSKQVDPLDILRTSIESPLSFRYVKRVFTRTSLYNLM
jgi:hypothetical protein